jgi:hypothetical protein
MRKKWKPKVSLRKEVERARRGLLVNHRKRMVIEGEAERAVRMKPT